MTLLSVIVAFPDTPINAEEIFELVFISKLFPVTVTSLDADNIPTPVSPLVMNEFPCTDNL